MKLVLGIAGFLGSLLYLGSCTMVRYDGDQVLKIIPETTNDAKYLQALMDEWLVLDLWKPATPEGIRAGRTVHFRVPFTHLDVIKMSLLLNNITFSVIIEDVQKLIDKNVVYNANAKAVSLDSYVYTEYHPINEINDWMDQLQEKHSDFIEKLYMGDSYERNPIYYLRMGWPSEKKKKIIFIDCGFHAKEWISPAFCQWFVHEIVSTYQNDPMLTKVLQEVDFYIVPVLNVDGYIYTWNTDRLWRKSRAPYEKSKCFGVDLNRNFDNNWCTIGASTKCKSSYFCGASAASEPETRALAGLMESHKSEILFYLSMHSWGEMILLPYGYKDELTPDHDIMMKVASEAVAKMKEKHNKEYEVGGSVPVLGGYDSGSSTDWAYDIGIKFSYTFELRDDGTFGSDLPAELIKPTCEEVTTAVMSMVQYVHDTYLESSAAAAHSP